MMPVNAVVAGLSDDGKDKAAEKKHISQTSAVILLIISTALVALCAEALVGSINELVKDTGINEAFVGLIILPIVGNAAEHVTAVVMAAKNKMDLAIAVALGSSIQIG
jgi:calcium/proton exchanger cax